MTAEDFVQAIQAVVIDQAVEGTVSNLEDPPGRRPDTELVELSTWYKQLDERDRNMVRRVLSMVSRNAVFGLFAVLDGSRHVDPDFSDGDYFELRHVRGTSIEVLAGPEAPLLHELL